MDSVLDVRALTGGYGVWHSIKAPEMHGLPLYGDVRLVLASLFAEVHSGDPGAAGAAARLVPTVLQVWHIAQVLGSVVHPVAVDVVDGLVRPLPVVQREHDHVGAELVAEQGSVQITGAGARVKRGPSCVSRVPRLACPGLLFALGEKLERSGLPVQAAGGRVQVDQPRQVFGREGLTAHES